MKINLIPMLFNRSTDMDSIYSLFDRMPSSNENIIHSNYRINEDNGKYDIEVDLPGVSDKDIDISIDNNMLTIKAERKKEVKYDEDKAIEKSIAKYERSFTISDKIDVENINAILKDGILMLSLSINEKEKTVRKIEVNKIANKE